MKFSTSILILVFLTFQFSTTFICFLENANDTNISALTQDQDQDQDEDSKESKENIDLKSMFIETNQLEVSFLKILKNKEISKFYFISDYNASSSINILPPEQV